MPEFLTKRLRNPLPGYLWLLAKWDQRRRSKVLSIVRVRERRGMAPVRCAELATMAAAHMPAHAFGPGYSSPKIMRRAVRELVMAGRLAVVGRRRGSPLVVVGEGQKRGGDPLQTHTLLPARAGSAKSTSKAAA